MKIEKIKQTKSGKYKIELDNSESIVTYADAILKNNLLFTKELDQEKLSKLYKDTSYYDVYNKVIKYISKKLRSEKEIRDYLKDSLVDIDNIIEDLKKIGLLNDNVFAKAYVNDRLYLSNDGPKKISSALEEHNISSELIEDLIYSNSDNFKLKLEKIIKKKIKANTKSNSMLKQKLLYDLINQGYNKEDIVELFDKNLIPNDNILKEYDKLYKKLSSKYVDNELLKQIKNKLYQKGYNLSEINEVIDKKNSD